MIGPNIPVENMGHLASDFPIRVAEGEVHPTQQTKRRIKVLLLFVIPGEENGEVTNVERQKPEHLPRVASVRVPMGVPVAKLRSFISHMEAQLQDIYGRSRRLNFVLVADEDSDDWKYEFDLPTFGVVYV